MAPAAVEWKVWSLKLRNKYWNTSQTRSSSEFFRNLIAVVKLFSSGEAKEHNSLGSSTYLLFLSCDLHLSITIDIVEWCVVHELKEQHIKKSLDWCERTKEKQKRPLEKDSIKQAQVCLLLLKRLYGVLKMNIPCKLTTSSCHQTGFWHIPCEPSHDAMHNNVEIWILLIHIFSLLPAMFLGPFFSREMEDMRKLRVCYFLFSKNLTKRSAGSQVAILQQHWQAATLQPT